MNWLDEVVAAVSVAPWHCCSTRTRVEFGGKNLRSQVPKKMIKNTTNIPPVKVLPARLTPRPQRAEWRKKSE